MTILTKYKYTLYLAALVFALPLIAWQYALHDTFAMNAELSKNRVEIAALESSSAPTFGNCSTEGREAIQSGEILSTVYARQGSIVRFNPVTTALRDDEVLTTGEIVVSCSFHTAAKIIHSIEREWPSCRIISVAIQTIRRNNRTAPELHTTIIVQQRTKREKI